MIDATQLRAGATFLLGGKPYRVIKYAHQKIGRGGATVKISARNLESGALEEKKLNSSTKVEKIDTTKRKLQYLYKDEDFCFFLDPKSFEQIDIPRKILSGQLPFFKEGEVADVMFWNKRPMSADIPAKVILKVTETVPGVKGNSATNIFKPAELENGFKLKVPLFVKIGDRIRVDTRSGEYVERVS